MPRFTLRFQASWRNEDDPHAPGVFIQHPATFVDVTVDAVDVPGAYRIVGQRLSRAIQLLDWAEPPKPPPPPPEPAKTSFERLLDETMFPEPEPT